MLSRLERAARARGAVLLQVLFRKAPPAVLSWRYFLPGQAEPVRLHRRAFLCACLRPPFPVWVLAAAYGYAAWYLLHGWRQAWKVWHLRGASLPEQGVPRLRQLRDLLVLAYGHAIPAPFYFAYSLYQVPASRWLEFVFTHELPHWHFAMSPRLGPRSRHLLTHKHAFALEMSRLGLPSIPTVRRIPKGEPFPAEVLFQGRPLFLKPEGGSRKRGCFDLLQDASSGTYRLLGEGGTVAEGEAAILSRLAASGKQEDYLVQERLANHPRLAALAPSLPGLATIRLVTAYGTGQGRAVCANLEIPVAGARNRIIPMGIDLEEGVVAAFRDVSHELPPPLRDITEALEGFRLPLWQEVIEVAETAHAAFPDLAAIGWDLAVSDQGVRLLEGNINWAVAAHQGPATPWIPAWRAAPWAPAGRMHTQAA